MRDGQESRFLIAYSKLGGVSGLVSVSEGQELSPTYCRVGGELTVGQRHHGIFNVEASSLG